MRAPGRYQRGRGDDQDEQEQEVPALRREQSMQKAVLESSQFEAAPPMHQPSPLASTMGTATFSGSLGPTSDPNTAEPEGSIVHRMLHNPRSECNARKMMMLTNKNKEEAEGQASYEGEEEEEEEEE